MKTFICALLLLVAGCATSPISNTQVLLRKMLELKPGTSTSSDIVKVMGAPEKTDSVEPGFTRYLYGVEQLKASELYIAQVTIHIKDATDKVESMSLTDFDEDLTREQIAKTYPSGKFVEQPTDYKKHHSIPSGKKFSDPLLGVAYDWREKFDVSTIYWRAPASNKSYVSKSSITAEQ